MQTESVLPPLYAPWMGDLLGNPIPQETRATCNDCVMCSEQPSAHGVYFDSRTKCCTYEPTIPCFLVGRILMDDSPEQASGRETVVARMVNGAGVSPLGLNQTARFSLIYKNATSSFGRAPDLRCPHYLDREGGQCGIWKHRPGVCATWFCKYVRGGKGQEFWRRMASLMSAIEVELSLWCAIELGAGSQELVQFMKDDEKIEPIELKGPADANRYAALWGRWLGKEIEYYRQCAGLVEPLSWNDILRITGPRVRLLAQSAQEAYARLTSGKLPDRLRMGTFKVEGLLEGRLRVVSYRPFDPLMMSRRLAQALPYFTGQPWEEAVQAVKTNLGIKLDREVLLRLVDFEILEGSEDS
jgi:hypothetical protein